jgi:hypothetical protein
MRLDEFLQESDPLMPPFFEVALGLIMVLIVVGFVAAIVGGVIRYRTTKRMAIRSGMSEADAAGFAMTSEHGLEAAFVADRLAGTVVVPTPRATSGERLAELAALRDQGLISAEEYNAKRRSILDLL